MLYNVRVQTDYRAVTEWVVESDDYHGNGYMCSFMVDKAKEWVLCGDADDGTSVDFNIVVRPVGEDLPVIFDMWYSVVMN